MFVVATDNQSIRSTNRASSPTRPLFLLLALLTITFCSGSRAADTINVGDKTVSYRPSSHGAYLAEFQFDMKGYRNAYALDCKNRQFLWIDNLQISTGDLTDNAKGAEWRPLNPKSAISNAVYEAICPRLLAANDEETTDWMGQRYNAACAIGKSRAPGIACPYPENATCIGEGCFVSGTTELTRPVTLFSERGSNRQVYAGKPGEFLIHETSVTYSVPCLARVQHSIIPALPSRTTVHRLSYAGEGTYRYLADDSIVGSGVEDKIPLLSECPQRDEQWVHLRTETGKAGWAQLEYDAFLGTSIHSPLTTDQPEWTKRATEGSSVAEASNPRTENAVIQKGTFDIRGVRLGDSLSKVKNLFPGGRGRGTYKRDVNIYHAGETRASVRAQFRNDRLYSFTLKDLYGGKTCRIKEVSDVLLRKYGTPTTRNNSKAYPKYRWVSNGEELRAKIKCQYKRDTEVSLSLREIKKQTPPKSKVIRF